MSDWSPSSVLTWIKASSCHHLTSFTLLLFLWMSRCPACLSPADQTGRPLFNVRGRPLCRQSDGRRPDCGFNQYCSVTGCSRQQSAERSCLNLFLYVCVCVRHVSFTNIDIHHSVIFTKACTDSVLQKGLNQFLQTFSDREKTTRVGWLVDDRS